MENNQTTASRPIQVLKGLILHSSYNIIAEADRIVLTLACINQNGLMVLPSFSTKVLL